MTTTTTTETPGPRFVDLLDAGAPDDRPDRTAEPKEGRRREPRSPQKRDAKDKGRRRRRAGAIHGYIGPNGSGKSLAMVLDTTPTLNGQTWKCDEPSHLHTKAGVTTGVRRVLSTLPLLDPLTGEPHPLYDPLHEWTQVLNAEHCDLLFDEVTGIAGAREAMGMPVAVQNILQQLRRRDVLMRWSAPSWKRADTIIRDCTQLVTVAAGHMSDHSAMRVDSPPAWAPKRLFKWRTFDCKDFDEWTAAKASQEGKKGAHKPLRPKVVTWYWGPDSEAFASYDTRGAVSRVGEVLDGGRCAHCGGRRAVPKCECDSH